MLSGVSASFCGARHIPTTRPSVGILEEVSNLVRKGTRFKVVGSLEVGVVTMWKAPFTDAFKASPEIGTLLVADVDQIAGAPAFACVPDDYEAFEQAHVPAETRMNAKYNGYYIVVDASQIGRSLEQLG